PAPTIQPLASGARYARATVFGASSSRSASERTVGSRSPGRSDPRLISTRSSSNTCKYGGPAPSRIVIGSLMPASVARTRPTRCYGSPDARTEDRDRPGRSDARRRASARTLTARGRRLAGRADRDAVAHLRSLPVRSVFRDAAVRPHRALRVLRRAATDRTRARALPVGRAGPDGPAGARAEAGRARPGRGVRPHHVRRSGAIAARPRLPVPLRRVPLPTPVRQLAQGGRLPRLTHQPELLEEPGGKDMTVGLVARPLVVVLVVVLGREEGDEVGDLGRDGPIEPHLRLALGSFRRRPLLG